MNGLISKALSYGGSKPPVIKPITITENGKYEAPVGTDGYNPLNVAVPDRYDEGYQDGYADGYADGYSDASDIYQTIINQMNGDGENVTDDEGNEITNAVVTPNDDLENYLTHLVFPSNGGSVTCQGLDGDTSFKFEVYVKKTIYADGTISYATKVKFTLKNILTGKEYVQTTNSYARNNSPFRIKIADVYLTKTSVSIHFIWVDPETGAEKAGAVVRGQVNNVGGTAFFNSKNIASTVTQNSEPSEIT